MSRYLVVGAGLFGATCARILADMGHAVRVVERRDHIAGNCYDEMIDGFRVNRYGGHIFHTNSLAVWQLVNRYATIRQYEHRVKACYLGRVYSLPPNRATYDAINMTPGPEADRVIREMFYEGYTVKQWGRPMSQVPASVTARLPIRTTYDDRYFTDRYQGLPVDGYTEMVRRMLDGIGIETGAQWRLTDRRNERVIYSGPIDELFDYQLGKLEYRSLAFINQIFARDDFQGCATVNYTEREIPWTRILEWKHFGWNAEPKGRTLVTMEYPRADGDPYYPIADAQNLELYDQYRQLADCLPWMVIGGRLGSYRYYNMDQVIAQAMAIAEREGRA